MAFPFPFRLVLPLVPVAMLAAAGGFPAFAAKPAARPASVPPDDLPAEVSYNRDIRPIFAEVCFNCHGADLHKAEGGLSVIDLEHAMKGGKSGEPAFVPGHPERSEAIARIHDADEPMPPKDSHKTLTDRQKKMLEKWVAQGAKYQQHWAYIPPVNTPTPQVADKAWPLNFIDNYLLARLGQEGLSPAPEADRATLCRRLHLDLLGLPPTPEQVDAFVADTRPDAYERLVDELLASPHHAERMATYWFDLVRYADTVGLHGDQGHASQPYRDWVISAFMQDMPQDRFIQWQLGGDLVEGLDATGRNDAKIASCFNRLLMTSHEGGIQMKEYLAIYQADRVRNTSLALMGASMGCCQCHDHKYDPYTIKDFYALASVFADIDETHHLRNHGKLNGIVTPRYPEENLVSPLDRLRAAKLRREAAAETDPKRKSALEEQAAKTEAPRTVMVSKASAPREVKLLHRGNWMDDSGEVMTPQVPKFLGSFEKLGVKDRRPTRLDFARWLTTPVADGGCGELTARVWANRLWYLFYGQGLCPSVDDLGGQGEPCTHPELLDRLALEFVKGGWDNRKFIRLLVTSRAYRMASEAPEAVLARDPRNLLFARQGRWRLPAEHVRDEALAVSGLLVDDIGGASIHPYQPAGYWQHLQFPDRSYPTSTDASEWKRGVYIHWQRMFVHPALKAFDAPSREDSCPRRGLTNTPLAALVALNDPTFVEAARALAALAVKAGGDDRARCAFLMRRAVGRVPSDAELVALGQVLAQARQDFAGRADDAKKLIATGLSPVDAALDPVEWAATSQVARVVLNLHETLTRN